MRDRIRPSLIVLVASFGQLVFAPALSAQTASENASGYDWAMRCFVAGAAAMPKPSEDPDGSITEATRARARRAFDVIYLLGGKLGYSDQKISADLDRMQVVEMRMMVQSKAYFEQSKANCVKLGLM